jgi:molecular chaperone DnaK (HSP70)
MLIEVVLGQSFPPDLPRSANDRQSNRLNRAMIAVPAYFTALQRRKISAAIDSGGLSVLRIVSEPISAVIHFTYLSRLPTKEPSLFTTLAVR